MKTVIIAMPVPDDADIFEIADQINEAFLPESDEEECVVYENVAALLDDLGIEPEVDIIRDAARSFLHSEDWENDGLADLAAALGVDHDDVEALR